MRLFSLAEVSIEPRSLAIESLLHPSEVCRSAPAVAALAAAVAQFVGGRIRAAVRVAVERLDGSFSAVWTATIATKGSFSTVC